MQLQPIQPGLFTAKKQELLMSPLPIFSLFFISNKERITSWEIGEGVYHPYHAGDALRDLSGPPRFGQPDTSTITFGLSRELPDLQKNQAGRYPSNSGIPNKAAYLTVEGGTHYGIKVRGISEQKLKRSITLPYSIPLQCNPLQVDFSGSQICPPERLPPAVWRYRT
jgi:hypothetical protein